MSKKKKNSVLKTARSKFYTRFTLGGVMMIIVLIVWCFYTNHQSNPVTVESMGYPIKTNYPMPKDKRYHVYYPTAQIPAEQLLPPTEVPDFPIEANTKESHTPATTSHATPDASMAKDSLCQSAQESQPSTHQTVTKILHAPEKSENTHGKAAVKEKAVTTIKSKTLLQIGSIFSTLEQARGWMTMVLHKAPPPPGVTLRMQKSQSASLERKSRGLYRVICQGFSSVTQCNMYQKKLQRASISFKVHTLGKKQ